MAAQSTPPSSEEYNINLYSAVNLNQDRLEQYYEGVTEGKKRIQQHVLNAVSEKNIHHPRH